ncbi:MAG: hypothetical protein IT306_09170 [Chloroflexi bacterium]|nr:hypothetical protein [Chloroflexota bacterium]
MADRAESSRREAARAGQGQWPAPVRAALRGGRRHAGLRSLMGFAARLLLLLTVVWAFTGPVDRAALVAGAAPMPPAAEQARTVLQAAIFFPETGYIVAPSPLGQYFAARGGARTFGPPVSNEFTLAGARVQLFRQFMLRQDPGGAVSTVNLFSMNAVPFQTVAGRAVPPIDPALQASAPVPGTPDYGPQVQAFIKANAPDAWEGLPVQFGRQFTDTVRYEDAFGPGPGERGLLPGFAQEVWGLPVSRPQRDPAQPNVVLLRWERGVMVWDGQTGAVTTLPLGEAFRAVLTGEGLSPDDAAAAAAVGSPFLAQANGPLPSGVARPADLPDTAMADAFKRSTAVEAGAVAAQLEPTPTISGWGAPPATTNPYPTVGTGTSGNPAVTGPVGTQTTNMPPNQGLPGAIQPGAAGAAAGSDPCYGDEEITFSPEIPRVGNEVLIAVTSSRPHPYGRLAGTEKTTFVRERPGQKGYVWEWTIQLSYPGQHEYTFYVDSTIPCKKLQVTVRQGLATRTPTPTKTATPWGGDNGNNNDNNNNDNSNNNDNTDAKAPAVYAPAYVSPGQDLHQCSSFQSQAQAQSVLRYDPSDPNRLDAEDGVEDGIACTTYNYSSYPNDRDFNPVTRTYGTSIPTLTPAPTITPTLKAFVASDYLGQGDRYGCNDFSIQPPDAPAPVRYQAHAQAVLRADPSDPNQLDTGYDGKACGGIEAANDDVPSGMMLGPFDTVPVVRPTRTPTPRAVR